MIDYSKLHMISIPVLRDRPTNIYCDNKAVISNSSLVESIQKKRHLYACYRIVHEYYNKGIVYIIYEPPATNLADICIKVLSVE